MEISQAEKVMCTHILHSAILRAYVKNNARLNQRRKIPMDKADPG